MQSSSTPISNGAPVSAARLKMAQKPNPLFMLAFYALVSLGLLYSGWQLVSDVQHAQTSSLAFAPFVLLVVAMLIALGFEFVNGFHDTANAVATVIYTNSMPPTIAVMWSGFFNFLGVLVSSGAVAFGIIALLPVELILKVGSSAGFAMVFALLLAAIIWNLGTWWFGLPASSSHTLIGSIIGVGVANALMNGKAGTAGVDWEQATKIGKSLLLSPVLGFICAASLFLLIKMMVKKPELYKEPQGDLPPPLWIRALLILTCTGVSFFHGSNDGQKGMGLIMLILVGIVPMAYALNRAMPADKVIEFAAVAEVAQTAINKETNRPAPADSRAVLTQYVENKKFTPDVVPAVAALAGQLGQDVKLNGSLAKVPAERVSNVRNDMYLTSEAIRIMNKKHEVKFTPDTADKVTALQKGLDAATKFIPLWVKIAVAIALGMGTMVGWRRIVITVGEKIGKTHMSYGQGASAELVAMAMIGAADMYGLPVSTTHVLSSGVAGTMAANKSGLQWSTIRNLLLAWVLTLPAAIILAASLYWVLYHLF